MPNIGKYDQSRFLKAEDINPGEDYTRIVDSITEEEVGQGGDRATIPVMWFRGDYKKGLGLSAKINREMLKHNFGSAETDDWWGRKVTFYRTMTEYQGRPVPCIRIRPKEDLPKEDSEPPKGLGGHAEESVNTDDIPF